MKELIYNKDGTINLRTLSTEQQGLMRQLIAMKFKQNQKCKDIAKELGVQLRYVERVSQAVKEGSEEKIVIKKMGRKVGSNLILTPEQEELIKNEIVETTPEIHGYEGFLWDLKLITKLVFDKCEGIKIARSTLSKYLERWGYTAQRPVIYNRKQNTNDVNKWLEEEYPAIKERAKQEKAEIFWGDETGVQNECNYSKGYAPIGETPVARLSHNGKYRINIMSAVTNQGKLRFTMYEDSMTQQKLIAFTKRLIKTSKRKVFLILDNLKVHHGQIFRDFIDKNNKKIEVFYLPTYSPELNPDEYFNGTLKRRIESKGDAKSKDSFFKNTRSSLLSLQKCTVTLVNLFLANKITYAA
jgi:transposase